MSTPKTSRLRVPQHLMADLKRELETHTAELDDGTIVAASSDLLALREPAVQYAQRTGQRVTVRHARREYEPVWRTGRDGGLRDMKGKSVSVGRGLDDKGALKLPPGTTRG